MFPRIGLVSLAFFLSSISLHAQQSVCDLFEDLKRAAGPHELSVQGELFLIGKVSVLASGDCDNTFVAEGFEWPTVINLRPAVLLPQSKRRKIENAADQIQRIKSRGKVPQATAVFSGRLSVRSLYEWDSTRGGTVGNAYGRKGSFPAELVYDDVTELRIEELPAPKELPVVPICDLFKDLVAWKGKRIAVRAEKTGTFEGTWLVGDCKDRFVTDGLQWPAMLTFGQPAYYSGEDLEYAFGRDNKSFERAWAKESELRRGRYSVSIIGTFVGTLRTRDQYFARCTEDGHMVGFGYGHLSAAPAELIVEDVRDVDVVPQREAVNSTSDRCQPSNQKPLCDAAKTLEEAASIGCVEKVHEFLLKNGIDSKGQRPSSALQAAIRNGHEPVVQLLLHAGAPINPVTDFDLETPLANAASQDNIDILRLLIKAGLDVDRKNRDGETYLATYGFYNQAVARELLEAGADPNATDKRGAAALMRASAYGFESVIQLLIQHGANVNAMDANGRTALMYAAEGGSRGEYHVDAIPLLLANGADLDKRDNSGQTALDIAIRLKHTYAIELLKPARR